MTQQQLIDHVMTATGLSRDAATKAVQAVLQGITTALGQGEEVRLTGFGTFSVAARPAREGRHPRTGEPMAIAASRAARFKPGKPLRDAINPQVEPQVGAGS